MGRIDRVRARRRLIGVVLVLAVLFAGAGATGLATTALGQQRNRIAEVAMDRLIEESAVAVDDEMSHYADAVQDMAAAIGAGPATLTRPVFEAITAPLSAQRLPGASSIGFVVPATDAQVPATQAYWRARGATGLTLYRTGTTTEHQFLIFQRSFTAVPAAPGRDFSFTPATQVPLDVSRRTRTYALGAAYISMRERTLPIAQQQVTVVVAAPVLDRFRIFRGWVTMGVHANAFLRETLSGRTDNIVNIGLTDIEPGFSRTIVSIRAGTPMGRPEHERSRRVDIGQRHWVLVLEPTTALLSVADRRMARFTPYAGGAFTLLLAVLVAVLATGRNRAMDRVDRATAALRGDIERREEVERQLREREGELHELAFHDQLTGLANRGLFYDRVTHALRTHARQEGTFAVFFIDLDGFKAVNDRYGHGAGDLVLRTTAARLRECLRDSDTVARFGGDEFAVIVERLAGAEDVHVTAGRMVEALRAPIALGGGRTVAVTASIGVALNRTNHDTDGLLRAADVAMYEAKTGGKSRHVLSAT